MKTIPAENAHTTPILEFESRWDSVGIRTAHGVWRIHQGPDGTLSINLAGEGRIQGLAVLPRSSNVVELKGVPL